MVNLRPPKMHRRCTMKKLHGQDRSTGSKVEAQSSFIKALICGVAGGLAGARSMERFSRLGASRSHATTRPLPYGVQEWDATSRIAKSTATWMIGHDLSSDELKAGAALVHYTTAAAAGALYGTIFQRLDGSSQSKIGSALSGVCFGAAVWLVGNELLLPALGVIRREDYTPRMRAAALAQHIAFGFTTGVVSHQLRSKSAR